MQFSAHLTNSITNLLHFIVLLIYLLILNKQKNKQTNPIIYFATLVLLKGLGVLAHLPQLSSINYSIWVMIDFFLVIQTYYLFLIVTDKKHIVVIFTFLSIISSLLHLFYFKFIYLSIGMLICQGFCVYLALKNSYLRVSYDNKKIALGIIMAILSNLVWIVSDFSLKNYGRLFGLDSTLINKGFYSYHNDLYHFLLMIATYIIFKGFYEPKHISENLNEK